MSNPTDMGALERARDDLGARLGFRRKPGGTWVGTCPNCGSPDAELWTGGLACSCGTVELADAAEVYRDGLPPWREAPILPGPPEPEPLPVGVLPPALRDHARSVADSMQVPAELPALLALGCVSAALVGRVEVDVRSGWREPVGLYAASIFPPAGRKSPTYAAMTKPLREWEDEAIQCAAPRLMAAQDIVEVAERHLADAKTAAAKQGAPLEEVEAARLGLEDARAKVPPDGRLLAGDITPEAMVQRMAVQGGRLAILEPEPGPLQLLAGRYADTARLDEVKKAWSAEAITVDRVGRAPLRVPHPGLTMVLMLQPGVLEALQNKDAFRYEGVLGRVLWCRPRHRLGERLTGPDVPPLDAGADVRYSRALRSLLEMEPNNTDGGGSPVPHTLQLSPGATSLLHAWEAEVEKELADGGRYAAIRDWAGKMVGQTVRVAALLELSRRAEEGRPLVRAAIEPWAMEGAVRFLRALGSHALAVLSGDLGMDARSRLLRYVLDRAVSVVRKLGEAATERELYRAVQGHAAITCMDDLRPLLDELQERKCLWFLEQPSGGGRPPSPQLEVHPDILNPNSPKNRDRSDESRPPGSIERPSVTCVTAFGDQCDRSASRSAVSLLEDAAA